VEEGMGRRQPGEVYFFFFFSFLLFSYWHMIFTFGGNKGGKRVKKWVGKGGGNGGMTRRGGPRAHRALGTDDVRWIVTPL
jgi:hypothetical protein